MSHLLRGMVALSLLSISACSSKHWGEQAARNNARALGPNENRDPGQPRDASSLERSQAHYTVALGEQESGELVRAGEVLAAFDDGFRISRPHESRAGTWVDVGRGVAATGAAVKVRSVEAGTLAEGDSVFFCPQEGPGASTYRTCVWREGRVEKVDRIFGRVQVPGKSLPAEAPVLVRQTQ